MLNLLKPLIATSLLLSSIQAYDINTFVDTKRCDQIINKQAYKICYSYQNKGASAVWYTLDSNLVNKNNIKKRPRFYTEKNLPNKYRSKYSDFTNSGFDRGHLAPDASFDHDIKTLRKTYSMANIAPQKPSLNRRVWIKAEKYERKVTSKLGSADVINLVNYNYDSKTIGKNKIKVPSSFIKIIYNNEKNFIKCFKYKNIKYHNTKNNKLKNHLIDCKTLSI